MIGASRGVGRAVVEAARRRGFAVTALSRSAPGQSEQPERPEQPGSVEEPDSVEASEGTTTRGARSQVRWVRGDATKPDAVASALAGADAVVVTLGAPAGESSAPRTQGTEVVLAAMREAGIRRLIVNSSLGVGDSVALLSPVVRLLIAPMFMRRALDDHADQEGLVMAADLDWTILRPGGLTGEVGGAPVVAGFTSRKGVSLRIPRADVAAYALDHLDDPATYHQAIALGTAKT